MPQSSKGQDSQCNCTAFTQKPPSPTEAKDSTLRDAELLIVGDQIKDLNESCIVMGDLNDVAWSRTTRLFQRLIGLLDPRVGRHFVNTFMPTTPLLRWSIGSWAQLRIFALVQMQRLAHIGSDHFPVYVVLQTGQVFELAQEELEQTKPMSKKRKRRLRMELRKRNEGKQVTDKIAKITQ